MDRLGEELAADSDIWTTYVKAATASDAEMVDGWNKGLDVLLVFVRFRRVNVLSTSSSYRPVCSPLW